MMQDSQQSRKLLIVGGGNMGAAIASGIVKELYRPENVTFIDNSVERLSQLRDMFPGCQTRDHYRSADRSDVYLLAVKPDQLKSACNSLKQHQHIHHQAVYLSIAAGVSTSSLQQWLGDGISIIRCMPNTPAALKLGASGLYCESNVPASHREVADQMMRTVGITVWLSEERQLDAVTAISGSGPAYFFYFMECLYDSAIALGLSEADSFSLIKQTALGASQLAFQSTLSLAELRKQVTSKGGTTQHALQSLEENNFRETIQTAVSAAALRAAQISTEFK